MTDTNTFPPAPPHPAPSTATTPRRAGRVVAAALLVGALAGGAAGMGGAALYGDATANSATSPGVDALQRFTGAHSIGSDTTAVSAVSGTIESAAAKALPSVVKITATGPSQGGSGSGIILTEDGQILTNNHVVEAAADGGRLAVSFDDGTTASASIVGRDPLTDLAVLQADGVSGLQPATLGDSDSLAVGEQVIAVGSPFGLESTVTTGVVSALNRPVTTRGEAVTDPATVFPAIQTDAAINPGNSGGPLINTAGDVVGIDSAIQTTTSSSTEQGGSIGLGFAIGINNAIAIVEELRSGAQPTHARIGVEVEDAINDLALSSGALVRAVDPGTAAADAGLQVGDVITKIDDALTPDSDSLVATVRSYRPDDTVTLTVVSSTAGGRPTGTPHTIEVNLGSDASAN